MSKRLGKSEWIKAGLKTLARNGVDAVRVEPLAATLRVTKGSFYWHFKDRQALLDALLDTWQARATTDIIDQVEAKGGDAHARLVSLFSIVGHASGRLDRAIRGWAGHDAAARKVLEEVDRQRFGYLVTLFVGIGFSPPDAEARARLVYHALIGQFMIGQTGIDDARTAEHLDIILPMLVRRPAPSRSR
jgi:AcrR family transcriptional regulator